MNSIHRSGTSIASLLSLPSCTLLIERSVLKRIVRARDLLEVARRTRAPLYASQLFQKSSTFVHSAEESFTESRLLQAFFLSRIAIAAIDKSIRESQKVKLQWESRIRREIVETQDFLRQAKQELCHCSGRSDTEDHAASNNEIDKVSDELMDALDLLQAGELYSAETHLSFSKSMIQRRLSSSIHRNAGN